MQAILQDEVTILMAVGEGDIDVLTPRNQLHHSIVRRCCRESLEECRAERQLVDSVLVDVAQQVEGRYQREVNALQVFFGG